MVGVTTHEELYERVAALGKLRTTALQYPREKVKFSQGWPHVFYVTQFPQRSQLRSELTVWRFWYDGLEPIRFIWSVSALPERFASQGCVEDPKG